MFESPNHYCSSFSLHSEISILNLKTIHIKIFPFTRNEINIYLHVSHVISFPIEKKILFTQ